MQRCEVTRSNRTSGSIARSTRSRDGRSASLSPRRNHSVISPTLVGHVSCLVLAPNLMRCTQAEEDLGFVGQPSAVDPSVLRTLMADEIIPVIAPLGFGSDGQTLNVNGDTAAGAIAAALHAHRLLLLTDVSGVKDSSGTVVTELTPDQIVSMTEDGIIAGGMIPKTETALAAIKEGVRAVVILDGRAPNACLLELFTEHGAGSLIRRAR